MPALVFLIVAALVLRVATYGSSIPNIAPIAAMALCAGLFLSKKSHAVWLTFGALLGADLIINVLAVRDHPEMSLLGLYLSPAFLVRYLAFGGVLFLAWKLQKNRSAGMALGMTPLASLFFYLATNTAAWAQSASYAKSFAGWWQAQTLGIPGFLPSYVFLRNAMIADFIFTFSFVAVTLWLPSLWKSRTKNSLSNASRRLADS